jgi:hypothetical protein
MALKFAHVLVGEPACTSPEHALESDDIWIVQELSLRRVTSALTRVFARYGDEAIQLCAVALDCFAPLAMTRLRFNLTSSRFSRWR